MRRSLFVLSVLCVLVSCGPKDKNIGVIKKEFKSFVQKTFDDPKSMKEIVEISATDTISLEFMRNLSSMTVDLMDTSLKLYKMKDSVATDQIEHAYKKMKKSFSGGYYEAFKGQLMATEIISLTQKSIDAKKSAYIAKEKMTAVRDSLSYHPALYVYEIKYRKETPDGLKLNSAYAYVDSLAGFKAILPEKDDTEMICEDYKKAFETSKQCYSVIGLLEDIYKKHDEKFEEFSDFISQNTR